MPASPGDLMNCRSHRLALSISLSLALGAAVQPASAQQTDADSPRATSTLDAVSVTGSRIKRAQVEGAQPVVTISAQQIQQEGFATVYDVLNSMNQQGSVEADTQWGSHTPNASPINLRDLGPGRTLLLVNGRRVADYPLPYGGESNFSNYSNIPSAAVERTRSSPAALGDLWLRCSGRRGQRDPQARLPGRPGAPARRHRHRGRPRQFRCVLGRWPHRRELEPDLRAAGDPARPTEWARPCTDGRFGRHVLFQLDRAKPPVRVQPVHRSEPGRCQHQRTPGAASGHLRALRGRIRRCLAAELQPEHRRAHQRR